jgi:hypothetical protein
MTQSIRSPLSFSVCFVLPIFLGACAPGSAANTACHGFAAVVSAAGVPGMFAGAALDGACDAQTFGPQGVSGPSDACQAVTGESACQTCLRTKLCESLDDCGADTACVCNIGCFAAQANGKGGPASACATSNACGAPDDTYDAAVELVRSMCPSECSGLLEAAGQ